MKDCSEQEHISQTVKKRNVMILKRDVCCWTMTSKKNEFLSRHSMTIQQQSLENVSMRSTFSCCNVSKTVSLSNHLINYMLMYVCMYVHCLSLRVEE
jgi:hypothetical protein